MRIKARHVILVTLILFPSIIALYTPFYNVASPDLYGLPFFYWFQTVWLVVGTASYLVFAHLKGNETK
ncbi:MAG: DUF3311 domain-containing protein [Nitrosopumilaceae archaeon]